MLEYKHYRGVVEYIEDARIFHGEVLGTNDVITFQGTTPEEIETAFRESVDDYLAFCAERGEEPDKPYSGKFVVRIPSVLHRYVAEYAQSNGESINAVMLRALLDLLSRSGDEAFSEAEALGTLRMSLREPRARYRRTR
jgi:predicted HicB family RNase H-like nuclease